MKVSIIVPVYNVKAYVVKCLQSIHAQTLDDYEVIVVNDGSTDGSGELAEAFCADKEKFTLIHKENGGLASAILEGVEHVTGDYVGFVDSDDYIDGQMYQKMMARAEENNADIVMCNHWYDATAEGEPLQLHRNPINEGFYEKEQLLEMKKKVLPRTGADYLSPSRCTKIIRKDLLLRNLRFYDPKIVSAEDVNMTVPCVLNCTAFEYIDEPLYYYVRRKSSVSYVFKADVLERYRILIGKIKEAVREYGLEAVLDCEPLYNFFGISWCNYVMESGLAAEEKRHHYQRLWDHKSFSAAARKISRSDGTVAIIYKQMLMLRQPAVYEWGNRAVHKVANWMRKLR